MRSSRVLPALSRRTNALSSRVSGARPVAAGARRPLSTAFEDDDANPISYMNDTHDMLRCVPTGQAQNPPSAEAHAMRQSPCFLSCRTAAQPPAPPPERATRAHLCSRPRPAHACAQANVSRLCGQPAGADRGRAGSRTPLPGRGHRRDGRARPDGHRHPGGVRLTPSLAAIRSLEPDPHTPLPRPGTAARGWMRSHTP